MCSGSSSNYRHVQSVRHVTYNCYRYQRGSIARTSSLLRRRQTTESHMYWECHCHNHSRSVAHRPCLHRRRHWCNWGAMLCQDGRGWTRCHWCVEIKGREWPLRENIGWPHLSWQIRAAEGQHTRVLSRCQICHFTTHTSTSVTALTAELALDSTIIKLCS